MFSHELTPMLGIFKGAPSLLRRFHVERGVSGIQNVSQKYPRSIKHYFLFLISKYRGILTGYVSKSIGAVSEYRGSIRLDTRTF